LIPISTEFHCAGQARVFRQRRTASNGYYPKAMPYEDNAQVIVPGKPGGIGTWADSAEALSALLGYSKQQIAELRNQRVR
jgi:hypothetical protein